MSGFRRLFASIAVSITPLLSACSSHHADGPHPSNTIGADQTIMLTVKDFPDGYSAEKTKDPYTSWRAMLKNERGATSTPPQCQPALIGAINKALRTPRASIVFTYQNDSSEAEYSESIIHDSQGLNDQSSRDEECQNVTGHYPDTTSHTELNEQPRPSGLPNVPVHITHSTLTDTVQSPSGTHVTEWQYIDGYAQVGSIEVHLGLSGFGHDANLNAQEFDALFVKAVNKANRGGHV